MSDKISIFSSNICCTQETKHGKQSDSVKSNSANDFFFKWLQGSETVHYYVKKQSTYQ